MIRAFIPVLATVGLACISAALAAVDNPAVIRIGYPGVGFDGFSPVGTGTAGTVAGKGLLEDEFKKDGIKVEWTFFPGAGPALNEALANGLLDFAAGLGDLPSIVHRAGGLRTEFLAASSRRQNTYIIVPDGSRANSLKDLIGKRLALFKGTNASLAWSKIVKDEGFTEDQFKVISLDSATARGAIAAKDIDGYIGGTDVFPLVARGVSKVVYSTIGKSPALGRFTGLLVTEDFEKAHPDLVQRVVDVYVKEAAWGSDEANRADVFKTWSKNGQPLSDFKNDYKGDTLASHLSPLLDDQFVTYYRTGLRLSIDFKFIRNDFDLDSWVNDKYLKQALVDEHLKGFWKEYDAQGNPKVADNDKR